MVLGELPYGSIRTEGVPFELGIWIFKVHDLSLVVTDWHFAIH